MYIDIKGIKAHFEVCGSGNKNILFLHGWGSEQAVFNPVINYMSDRYRIYGLDMPGFGKTKEPDDIYSVFEYADFVQEFIDKVKIDDVTLIGHSFGGRVSIILASRNSYKKLVLIDSAGIKPKRSIKYYFKVYSYKIVKNLLLLFGDKGKELLDKYRSKKGSLDYRSASDKMKAILSKVVNQDLRKYMKDIDADTLIIWGEKDQITPLKDAKIMEKTIKSAGSVIIKRAGHFSFLDNPVKVAKVLNNFI